MASEISIQPETVSTSITRLENAAEDLSAVNLPRGGAQPEIQGVDVWATENFHVTFTQTLQFLGEVANSYSSEMGKTAGNIKTVVTNIGQADVDISQRLDTMTAEAASIVVDTSILNGGGPATAPPSAPSGWNGGSTTDEQGEF